MAGTNLGTAYVQIVPSAQGISGSISSAMSGEASAAANKTGGMFSKLFNSKVGKGFMIAGAALAAGVGLGVNALKNGIKETATFGDEVDKMSQKLGFTAEEYQKWDYVLQRAGADVNSLAPAMKTLSNAAVSNSAAFQELGLSQEQVANMSQGELFSATISKLSEMENVTERTALASKLLGRSATELGPLLNEGSAAIEEQMAIAEKYGMIMPDSAVKASAAFQDSVTTMQMTMTGLKNRMMSEFLPSVTQITDGLGKMFAGDMSGVDDIAAGIQGVASKIVEMAPTILNAAKQLGSKLLEGLMSNTGNIGEKAGTIIGKLVTGLITHIPDILVAGVKLVAGLAKGLIQAIPQIWGAIKQIGGKIVKGLGSDLWGKIKAAANGIKERFMAPINNLRDKVKSIVEKIKGFFKFEFKTPKLKVPKFSISPAGWKVGDLLKGSIPKLTVKWAAKGGIVDGATLVGAGEKGAEAIVPLDPFWKKLEKLAGNNSAPVVINVYASDGMDVNQLAAAVEKRIIQAQKRRTLAWV